MTACFNVMTTSKENSLNLVRVSIFSLVGKSWQMGRCTECTAVGGSGGLPGVGTLPFRTETQASCHARDLLQTNLKGVNGFRNAFEK